jgi:hypothetical protein
MLIQIVATTFRNQADRVVAVVRGTSISYGPTADGAQPDRGDPNNED